MENPNSWMIWGVFQISGNPQLSKLKNSGILDVQSCCFLQFRGVFRIDSAPLWQRPPRHRRPPPAKRRVAQSATHPRNFGRFQGPTSCLDLGYHLQAVSNVIIDTSTDPNQQGSAPVTSHGLIIDTQQNKHVWLGGHTLSMVIVPWRYDHPSNCI